VKEFNPTACLHPSTIAQRSCGRQTPRWFHAWKLTLTARHLSSFIQSPLFLGEILFALQDLGNKLALNHQNSPDASIWLLSAVQFRQVNGISHKIR
jgi:hypothetical protein